jgi:hypothetical protein
MPATFSPESRIEAGLRLLQCSGLSFTRIANERGIKISKSTLADGLNNGLDSNIAERLLDLLEQMRSLQDDVADKFVDNPVPIDWSRADLIARTLTFRQVRKYFVEAGDHNLDQIAGDAAKAVK